MSTPHSSMNRRTLLALAGAGSLTATLAACGGGNSPRDNANSPAAPATGDGGASGYDGPAVKLAFWNGFTGGDGPTMKALVDSFNKEHANIAVTMTTMQWADYYSKLPTAVTSGNGPDVGVMHVDSVATNAARKVIQPLDDVATALDLKDSDFAPVPWKAGVYKDQRYAIPLDVHPLGFYYNKDVMEKGGLDPDAPPTTGDEYMAALETLKAKGVQGHWASPFPFTGGLSVQALVYQFGGSLFDEAGKTIKWAEEPGVKALSWWGELIKKGYSPAKVDQDADYVALKNGKNAFNWNGIWQINDLKKTSIGWGVAALPNIGGQKAAWAGSHQFVLPTQKKPDENKAKASRVFLNWISEKSQAWAEAGQIPARNSARESSEFAALKEQSVLASQIDDLRFMPSVPGIGDAMPEFHKALNAVVLNGANPATVLADAAGRAQKILDQNAQKYGG